MFDTPFTAEINQIKLSLQNKGYALINAIGTNNCFAFYIRNSDMDIDINIVRKDIETVIDLYKYYRIESIKKWGIEVHCVIGLNRKKL